MPTLAGFKLRVRQKLFPTPVDEILTVRGWTSPEQLDYLMAQVRSLPDQALVVESVFGRGALHSLWLKRAVEQSRKYSPSTLGKIILKPTPRTI
ncbi:MAG: hypothetical protein ABR568_09930 [Pyrinomonadaceae bacterium]